LVLLEVGSMLRVYRQGASWRVGTVRRENSKSVILFSLVSCPAPSAPSATTAYAAENKADDKTEEEEGESSESDDDVEKNSRNKTKI
jgi:hypothetical protein